MSRAMEIAQQVLHAEEVARASKPKKEEERESIYTVENIDLSVEHECETILKPVYMEEINYVKFLSANVPYEYRINHGDWISVPADTTISEDDFKVKRIDIKNDAGTGKLGIYMEGKKCL